MKKSQNNIMLLFLISQHSRQYFNMLRKDSHFEELCFGRTKMRYDCCLFLLLLLYFPAGRILSTNARWMHYERTMNTHTPQDIRAAALQFLRVARIFCDSVHLPCDSLASVHGLAAAVQLLEFSFPTVKLRTSCDTWDSHGSIVRLSCNVYELIGPIWIFTKVFAICLRQSAHTKSYA